LKIILDSKGESNRLSQHLWLHFWSKYEYFENTLDNPSMLIILITGKSALSYIVSFKIGFKFVWFPTMFSKLSLNGLDIILKILATGLPAEQTKKFLKEGILLKNKKVITLFSLFCHFLCQSKAVSAWSICNVVLPFVFTRVWVQWTYGWSC